MLSIIYLMFFWLNVVKIIAIWPPAYKINLSHVETFVIFDPIERSEMDDVYEEEEMIKMEDMQRLKVTSHKDKYYRIHRSLNNNKNIVREDVINKNKIFEEFNPDREYSAAFKAGFVDEEEQFVNDDDVIYFDIENKTKTGQEFRKRKRDESNKNYDYNQLKDQFNLELKQAADSNKTLNYTNVKKDESLKDSIKKLLVIKEDRNCSEEERKGIGIAAAECLWMDLHKTKLKNRILGRIVKIIIIWLGVYIIIATPLYCQYGWCCCCFRCKCCRPHEQINEVKQFYAQNPPGTYHDPDGNVIKYQPTRYEKYTQKALEEQLRKL